MEGISKEEINLIIDFFNNSNLTKQELTYQLYSRCKELDPWLPIENAPKDRELWLYCEQSGQFAGRYHAGTKEWSLRSGWTCYPTHYKELPEDPNG